MTLLTACLCAAATLALGLPAVARAPWLDEAATLQALQAQTLAGWLSAVVHDTTPPAFAALLGVWSRVSSNLAWLRLLPMGLGMATVLTGVAWAGQASRRAAAYAGVLLATSPFLLRYDVELRAYALLGFTTVCACAYAWRIADAKPEAVDRRDRYALCGILLLGCLSHYVAVLLVPSIAAFILIGATHQRFARVPWTGMGIVVVAWGLVLIGSPLALRHVQDDWWMPALGWDLLWRSTAEVAGASNPGAYVGLPGVIVGATIAAGALVVVLAAPRKREWLAPLGAAVAYVVGVAATSLVWQPVWWPRTLLPAVIFAIVAFGIAVASASEAKWRRLANASVAALAIAWTVMWVSGRPWEGLEAWPQAAAHVVTGSAHPTVVAFPDFAAWPFERAIAERSQVEIRRLRLDGRNGSEVLDPLRHRSGPIYLLVRVDPALLRRPGALGEMVDRVRARLGPDPGITALIVTSPDVSLVPVLEQLRDDLVWLVQTRFRGSGWPGCARSQEGPRLTIVTCGGELLD
ncbi:MAG: glycosyltransferase family 39 protein [Acidobacteria bacterium]|nr:glycosyltransferase family 39 protein [Acidobacteriota bacterium]